MYNARGFFGIGIWHGKVSVNIGTLWRSAQVLGANFIFTLGRRYTQQRSDVFKSARHVPLMNFADMDALYGYLPMNCRLIGVEMGEASSCITQFVHPPQACYLLGAEDHGLSEPMMRRCHHLVRLPGAYSLNVATAGSIVMFDRWTKAQARQAGPPRYIEEVA